SPDASRPMSTLHQANGRNCAEYEDADCIRVVMCRHVLIVRTEDNRAWTQKDSPGHKTKYLGLWIRKFSGSKRTWVQVAKKTAPRKATDSIERGKRRHGLGRRKPPTQNPGERPVAGVSETWVNGLGFKGKNTKDALVDAAQRLATDAGRLW